MGEKSYSDYLYIFFVANSNINTYENLEYFYNRLDYFERKTIMVSD